ncbi:MAG: U32 family peptidase [Geothermobacteraceae bacterium]
MKSTCQPTASVKPELLAPAGSLEAFFAAVEAGADAVYCGLKAFSARAKAKNFTTTDIEGMLGVLRQRGGRLYVTLNTLVKEAELPLLIDTLADLEAIGVDGLIIQDLAVWRLVRNHFPGLELHASTQMTVHNAAGVRMLERMGFTRAVLARELTLEQIRTIRSQTRLELEHFIHGALCFSFSGQCFFSSFMGGQSGNRGRCTQPCRRRYRQKGKEGYFFSPNDLSAIDLLPELVEAGVCSLKIEGRMKSAEYVHNVVRAYRMVLDAPVKKREDATGQARELLRESFGRTPTSGFLAGEQPRDIAHKHRHGATGRWLGTIEAVRGRDILVKSRDALHAGDRVRVQPASDQPGRAFTIRNMSAGKKKLKSSRPNSQVWLATPFADCRKGDSVFKVSSHQAFSLSEAACRRRLNQVSAPRRALELAVDMPDNQSLRLKAKIGDLGHEQTWPVTSSPARDNPLSADVLEKIFAATGQAPFELKNLVCSKLPPVVIPPSRLKEIRREFYAELERQFGEGRNKARQDHRRSALEHLAGTGNNGLGEPLTTVVIADARDLHVLAQPDIDRVILPLREGNLRACEAGHRHGRHSERIIWDLPFIVFDQDWDELRQRVERALAAGFADFRLNNLGQFEFFLDYPEARLHGSHRLFILNSEAARAWRELGLAEGSYVLEDDRDNLAALASKESGLPCNLTIYGSIPLLVSRIDLSGLTRQGPIRSDRGEEFLVDTRTGLTRLSSRTDFSLTAFLPELERLGLKRWLIDLEHLGPFSPRGREVLAALRRPRELAGTSPFNFVHGME